MNGKRAIPSRDQRLFRFHVLVLWSNVDLGPKSENPINGITALLVEAFENFVKATIM